MTSKEAPEGWDHLKYAIERVILRRLFEQRIDGYTLEMAEELATVVRMTEATTEVQANEPCPECGDSRIETYIGYGNSVIERPCSACQPESAAIHDSKKTAELSNKAKTT